jgi:hypothetical protein
MPIDLQLTQRKLAPKNLDMSACERGGQNCPSEERVSMKQGNLTMPATGCGRLAMGLVC